MPIIDIDKGTPYLSAPDKRYFMSFAIKTDAGWSFECKFYRGKHPIRVVRGWCEKLSLFRHGVRDVVLISWQEVPEGEDV